MTRKQFEERKQVWCRMEPELVERLDEFAATAKGLQRQARKEKRMLFDGEPSRSWAFRQLVEIGLLYMEGNADADTALQSYKELYDRREAVLAAQDA